MKTIDKEQYSRLRHELKKLRNQVMGGTFKTYSYLGTKVYTLQLRKIAGHPHKGSFH